MSQEPNKRAFARLHWSKFAEIKKDLGYERMSMGKPSFSKFENKWSKHEWLDYCGGWMKYKVKNPSEFPNWLPSSLVEKFNSATVACSGNSDVSVFIFTGYRIDKNAIDEHPYVVVFHQDEEGAFSGFIHHADYKERTTEIPAEMEESMKKTGVTIEFNFRRKPTTNEGILEDLQKEDLLNGFIYSTEMALMEEKMG